MICFTRREILFGLTGVAFFGASGCRDQKADGNKAKGDLIQGTISWAAVLSPEQLPIIAAVVECILPGARNAGVPDYMGYWLSKKPFESTRNYVEQGLRLIETGAEKRYRKSFSKCDRQEQEALLLSFAEGKTGIRKFNTQSFYQKVVELTLEGYLSDPKYGGNRDRVGWKFIGIPDGLRSCWWNPNGVEVILKP